MTRYYLPLSLPDLPSEMLPRSSAVIQSQNYLHLRLHHKRKFADAIPSRLPSQVSPRASSFIQLSVRAVVNFTCRLGWANLCPESW